MCKPSLPLLVVIVPFVACFGARGQIDVSQDETIEPACQITERGRDFATYTKLTVVDDPNGWPESITNRFTLLENALHYQDDASGQWRESEDLIESFPDGAVAGRGPNKAIFAHELNSQSVFDIQAWDGKRIRGGVRAIQLTDTATGQTVTLATVKQSVAAQLLPPNSILWANAFDGLKADLLINWKHNAWNHDVLLKEQPELPLNWNPATTRLEILTEFIVDADPAIQKAGGEIEDHTTIDFGAMAILVGNAYTIAENTAFNFGGDLRSEGAPVRKLWQSTEDGRRFLIESIAWPTASASMQNLPVRRHASNSNPTGRASVPTSPNSLLAPITTAAPNRCLARVWPKTPPPLTNHKPIQLAAIDYKPTGYLVDFTIISGASPTTLTTGTTYYIQTSYYSGNATTFQAGTVIKFKNNAYMLLYGVMTFPSSGAKVVFTSRNDDSVGDIIQGVAGETPSGSNGDPSLHKANPALWIYYDTDKNITVRNTRFRWAKVGIKIDRSSTDPTAQNFTDCFFENITGNGSAGIAGNVSNLTFSNLKKCKVDYQGGGVDMDFDCIGIENAWPGDSSWALSSPVTAGWPTSSASTTPEIEGFAGAASVNAGSSIDFYVDVRTTTDTSYSIQIYRLGWYGGVGGRRMTWYDSVSGVSVTSLTKSSVKQPVPAMDNTTGVIDCSATTVNGVSQTPWAISYTLQVPSWWLSGVYLARLHGQLTSKESYILFVVREDNRGSDLYVQTSDATWQAYNPWGGNSLYPYPRQNDCTGPINGLPYATKVSYNRPYAGATCSSGLGYGTGAGEFFVIISQGATPAWECNALRWFEKQAYDITYCSSADTHSGSLLNKSVKAFVSVGHDEYWSSGMRSNVESGRDRTSNPINLVFLGGNVCFRVIHFDTNLRAFTCEKNNPSVGNDCWRQLSTSPNHEWTMIGSETAALGYNGPIVVTHPIGGHWAFDYTGITAGGSQSLASLGGSEVHGCAIGMPCDQDLATSANCPNWGSGTYDTTKLADTTVATCAQGETHAYITIYTAQIGPTSAPHAKVFATGSMQWTWGLDHFGYLGWNGTGDLVNPVAQQMTHNVVRKFSGKATTQLP